MLWSKDGQIFCSFNFKLFSSKVSQQNNNQSCNFGLNLFSLLKQCLGVVLVCTMLYIIILGLIIRSWDLRLDLKNWELVKHAVEQICSRSSHQSHWNLTQLSLLSLYWECLNMSQSVHTLSLSILKCCVCVSQLFDHKLIYGADFQGGLQNDELAYLMLRRGIFHDRNIFLWDSQLKLLSVLKMTYWCCCTLFIRKKISFVMTFRPYWSFYLQLNADSQRRNFWEMQLKKRIFLIAFFTRIDRLLALLKMHDVCN